MSKTIRFQKSSLELLRDGLKKQKGISRKFKYIRFFQLAKKNEVVPFRLQRIAKEYTDDYFADTGIARNEKEWFYRRGIPTFKTGWYGLTKDNYNNYISDFDFYHPKNYLRPQFSRWYDNKLTTYYLLSPFRASMPRHYFYIQEGILFPIDAEFFRCGTDTDLVNIIRSRPVALKACIGGHGKGFYKVEFRASSYCINGEPASEQDVIRLIRSLDNYIMTSFSIPCSVFRRACGDGSFAVIRTVTVFDKTDGPQITAIMIRLGTAKAGFVSDYDGSINCGVDLETGKLFDPLIRSGDADGIIVGTKLTEHPDTGVDLTTVMIPDFSKLTSLVKAISAHLPMTPYLVADLVPTESGFDILEINSHGQVRNLERYFPFRKNKYNLNVFITRDW